MEIDELLEQACEIACLPSTAKDQLPGSLINETKRSIQNMTAEELAVIIKDAIYKIDHGAIESIDELVRRPLNITQVQAS